MANTRDITEGLPYVLSNPNAVRTYALNGPAYDISINGLPFFIFASEDAPYLRQTAQYRKDQVDQSREPGEQTLTGWWLRSQSSFHQGKGVNFYDPSAGETVQYRFSDSKGIDVWDKGEAKLLKNVTAGHVTTGAIASNGVVQQHLRSIKWSTFTGALLHDEYDVDKIKVTDPSNPVHFIDYNAGVGVYPVYAICDDGTNAYWITNKTSGATTKLTAYGKPLSGSSASTADEFKIFDNSQVITNGVMEYVKQRLVICADNKVYECAAAVSSTPTLLYTNPSSSHVYTSITASGTAIYIAGYNGAQSTIERYVLSSNGSMPVLSSAIISAELPVGEIVHRIYYYLGYMMIGTNKGIRVATVSDQDGSITYGPLIVETNQPCYDFAARDSYVWCATGVDNVNSVTGAITVEPGLIRIDLDQQVETMRFAYANDIYYPGTTGHVTTAVCFDGNTDPTSTDRLMFSTAYASSANGAIYVEDATTLVSSGYITTGKIRYSTLEGKVFKFLTPRIKDENGRVTIHSIDNASNEFLIGDFAEDSIVEDISIGYPIGAQEYLSFKFTLYRSDTTTSTGAILNAYQIKALPAIPRQRIIQYPLACYDNEKDKFNVQMGYENSSYERLTALETIENAGDTIRIDDFRTGESYTGIIEQVQYSNRTPPDKRFSGVGGILQVTIRSL